MRMMNLRFCIEKIWKSIKAGELERENSMSGDLLLLARMCDIILSLDQAWAKIAHQDNITQRARRAILSLMCNRRPCLS